MTVKRYKIYGQYGHDADDIEDAEGEYVKYEDIKHLLDRPPLTVEEFLDVVHEYCAMNYEAYRGEEGDKQDYLDEHFNFSAIVRALNKRMGSTE